ncbi:MAG: ligase-associated DNA damage response exonuclease [Pseudomonadota bacterium]|jgi:Predicted exonuclease of the beta-lactamase fold involved in RNA processing|nr:MAG: ligase-associated DNA damage response exonuclease [Pseudomonadota bacterium]
MSSDSAPLVVASGRGLYCPPGDFYIDPQRPVQTAVITHAHGDHLRDGSARYILARPGLRIARMRLGRRADVTAVEYGAPVRIGETTVSLHPAGHILGSAQVRIEHGGRVWVVSGDYKRQPDPTCAPFTPLECDVFVSEATFALPVYRWPETAEVIEDIVRWWRFNRERRVASVLFCYALGKAQRVLAELASFTSEPVHVHDTVEALVQVYREAGVTMVPTLRAQSTRTADYAGALVVAPPSTAGTRWMQRFGRYSSGFCSGWMRLRGSRRRQSFDRGFVISDHADWHALLRTFRETGARRILLHHGHTDTLTRLLRERGVDVDALETAHGALP